MFLRAWDAAEVRFVVLVRPPIEGVGALVVRRDSGEAAHAPDE
jgi:hypothetical protein